MRKSKHALPESLKKLLVRDLLETDAINHISEIIKLTKEDDSICLYYPGAFFYAFMVNQRSTISDLIIKHFSQHKGDFLYDAYKAAIDDDRNRFHWNESDAWEISIDCMRGLARALGIQKLNSCQLAASLFFPFNPFYAARKKRKINWETYDYREFVQPEILGGCFNWGGISNKSLAAFARDLVTYDGLQLIEPNEIQNRFNLLLSIVGNQIKVSVAERWGNHSIDPLHTGLQSWAGLWLPHNVLFTASEISEFERLLNVIPPSPEEAFQEFFQTYPHWLFLLGDYEDQRAQVELRMDVSFSDEPEEKRWLQPDFLLKRIGLEVWDILDIKKANPRIAVGKDTRRRFSGAVEEAIAQVREYTRWFQDAANRNWFKARHGIYTEEPKPIVVIGRDFDFTTAYEKQRLQSFSEVRIFTYDDLHRIAKHRTIAL